MKYLSFKILLSCILLPPLLYVFSVQGLETWLQRKYTRQVEQACTGDTAPLFSGNLRLRDAVSANIDRFLRNRRLTAWGVRIGVTVTTEGGLLLYPPVIEEPHAPLVSDPMKIAAENYRLMQAGLRVKVQVTLAYNTLLTNAILAFYILFFGLLLYVYYRKGAHRVRQEALEKNREIERLKSYEEKRSRGLKTLQTERQRLSAELEGLRRKVEREKNRASRNEDQMIEEIVALEKKIAENIALQNTQQREIESLTAKIQSYEKRRKRGEKHKAKSSDAAARRFKALYKNLTIGRRAVEGFAELTDDMQIKAEEIIHQLNEEPDSVPIKRKVFGKKGMGTFFEVLFAYNGRLYFRKGKDQGVEILAIGTKNSQTRDLEFLRKVP